MVRNVGAQASSGGRAHVIGWPLVVLAAPALLLSGLLLLLPNSVHVDTDYGAEDVFFGCGTALFPTVEPREEPGIAECAQTTKQMRRAAGVSAGLGILSLATGGILLGS